MTILLEPTVNLTSFQAQVMHTRTEYKSQFYNGVYNGKKLEKSQRRSINAASLSGLFPFFLHCVLH